MMASRAPGPALPLYRYQKRWFRDRARFKVGMFARQTGKTFTTSLEVVDDVFEGMTEGRRSPWVILSRGERQAREAMEAGVKPHARAYGVALKELESEFKGASGATYRQLEVEFPNGVRVMALPANPDTARGFSANVFLDEFAIHRDSRAIWGALFPVVSAGWKLRVTSTPNGKGNKFYEIMTGHDDGWSRHTVDIYQAVEDGLPRDVDELRAALNDEDLWAQEYELKWLDEASAWLSYDLISSVEDDDAGAPEGYQGNPVYVGVDIGRRNDLYVIWVLEPVGDVLWTREIVEMRRATFADQDAALDEIFTRYRVARCCEDQTGMGEKPVEDAQRRYGASRVEGVLFTGPNKLTMATGAKERFEDRTLRIPMGRPPLRADLHSLKKSIGPTGAPRFVVEDEGQASHADRAWALFLAINAAAGTRWEVGYTPAPRRHRFDDAPELDDEPAGRRAGAGGRLRFGRGAW